MSRPYKLATLFPAIASYTAMCLQNEDEKNTAKSIVVDIIAHDNVPWFEII